MTISLVYSGPHPSVVVDELDQDQVIVRGESTEFPDDLAARLLMQDTWQQTQSVKSATASPQTPAQSVTAVSAVSTETSATADDTKDVS